MGQPSMKALELEQVWVRRKGKINPLYACWKSMRERCDRPTAKAFRNYGGRGIYYSAKWILFENFCADKGPRPEGTSIERIDNNGPYTKENCRWATRAEQNRNKRDTVRVEFCGRTMSLAEWSRELGIQRATLMARLKSGAPVEVAFTKPKRSYTHGDCLIRA